MKATKTLTKIIIPALLAGMILAAGCRSATDTAADPGGTNALASESMETLLARAERLKTNQFYTIQISNTGNGSDVDKSKPWVTAAEMREFDDAIAAARRSGRGNQAYTTLNDAMRKFAFTIRADGTNPYFRGYPGPGQQRLVVHQFDLANNYDKEWELWRTNDGRIVEEFRLRSRIDLIENPFPEDPTSHVIKLTVNHNPAETGRSFGGFGMRARIDPALELGDSPMVQFDLYYPNSSAGKYMRFEIWSTSSGGEGSQTGSGSNGGIKNAAFVRDSESIGALNPEWVRFYNGENWFRRTIEVTTPVTTGTWEYLNIDLHTEVGALVENGLLMIGNVRISKLDPEGIPLADHDDPLRWNEVKALKERHNPNTTGFIVGAIGGRDDPAIFNPGGLRNFHYELFVDGNNLKPEWVNPRAPMWLIQETGFNFRGVETGGGPGGGPAGGPVATSVFGGDAPVFTFPTEYYMRIRDNGFKPHGHVLAWYNQASLWMRQIVPENLTNMQWRPDGAYFAFGNNTEAPFINLNKELVRRGQFNHIMYTLRHFMTTDARYNSSAERGLIDFHTFDVLNEEIHESRHRTLIEENPNEWRSALRNTSWLMAMTDDDYGDLRNHFIYLLFKYAHMAVPNAKMIENIQRYYNDPTVIPEYLKVDGHLDNLQAYTFSAPPLLVYNDYDISNYSKARVAFNMIKELNTLWKTDPLYDGRNLIEVMGIQGHDTLGPTLASDNQRAVNMYAHLIDEGLLDKICYSELDIRVSNNAPGGPATAPGVLNEKQADALGYQYALLYKMFEKYGKYMSHIVTWGVNGQGWGNSYVLFDHRPFPDTRANKGFHGALDADRYLLGHPYLEFEFFVGEYERMQPGYKPEL